MEKLTRHSDLIVLLSAHLRRKDREVRTAERIERLFERLCGQIIEDRGLNVLELPLERTKGIEYPTTPLEENINAYLDFDGARTKSVGSTILRFVEIVFDYIEDDEFPDFVQFNVCVGWFLEALDWDRSWLTPVVTRGKAVLMESTEFADAANYKVKILISHEFHEGVLYCK